MTSCTKHGPISCSRCWNSKKLVQEIGDFKLVRDPGHWGAIEPRTLVLGISKGNTQSNAYISEPFDTVAFKGIRDRLLAVLNSVGLLVGEKLNEFEQRFSSTESDYAFASVVRCSLTAFDKKKQKYTAESPKVIPALKINSDGYTFVSNCIEQHLVDLSSRTKVVILLGNSDTYVSDLRNVIVSKRGSYKPINEIAYYSNGVKFVHVGHPSRVNGYFNKFIQGESISGEKRNWAINAPSKSV
jgi:hypothetical protein